MYINIPEEQRQLFADAIEKYGKKAQLEQVDEELHELAIELHKIRRGRNYGLSELAGEVADVQNMIDQIRVMYGPDFEMEVEQIRLSKLARLRGRIDGK